MTRRILVVPAACVLLLLAAGVASAGDELVLSVDGRTWAPSLSEPLFDPSVRWVPGESRTATFFVGNRASDAGVLALVARADDADGLVAAGDVSLEVRRGPGAWAPIAADGRAHRLAGGDLAAGANVRLAIRAQFAPASPNASQLRRLPLSFDVVLSESATAVAGPTDGGGHGGLLPETGGIERAVLIAGLVLVALGVAVIRSAMYPREKEDDERAPV